MMGGKKISILSVEFNVNLSREELPVLKRVIDNNLGLSGMVKRCKESEDGDDVLPVFQYKNVAGRTCLLIYGWDLSPMANLLTDTDWSVWIRSIKENLKVAQVRQRLCEIGVSDFYYRYCVNNWVYGLQEYPRSGRFNVTEKAIGKTLYGDVLDCLELLGVDKGDGVDMIVGNFSEGAITGNNPELAVFYDVMFVSNVVFPEFFSLGKGSDVGFGVISQKKGSFGRALSVRADDE